MHQKHAAGRSGRQHAACDAAQAALSSQPSAAPLHALGPALVLDAGPTSAAPEHAPLDRLLQLPAAGQCHSTEGHEAVLLGRQRARKPGGRAPDAQERQHRLGPGHLLSGGRRGASCPPHGPPHAVADSADSEAGAPHLVPGNSEDPSWKAWLSCRALQSGLRAADLAASGAGGPGGAGARDCPDPPPELVAHWAAALPECVAEQRRGACAADPLSVLERLDDWSIYLLLSADPVSAALLPSARTRSIALRSALGRLPALSSTVAWTAAGGCAGAASAAGVAATSAALPLSLAALVGPLDRGRAEPRLWAPPLDTALRRVADAIVCVLWRRAALKPVLALVDDANAVLAERGEAVRVSPGRPDDPWSYVAMARTLLTNEAALVATSGAGPCGNASPRALHNQAAWGWLRWLDRALGRAHDYQRAAHRGDATLAQGGAALASLWRIPAGDRLPPDVAARLHAALRQPRCGIAYLAALLARGDPGPRGSVGRSGGWEPLPEGAQRGSSPRPAALAPCVGPALSAEGAEGGRGSEAVSPQQEAVKELLAIASGLSRAGVERGAFDDEDGLRAAADGLQGSGGGPAGSCGRTALQPLAALLRALCPSGAAFARVTAASAGADGAARARYAEAVSANALANVLHLRRGGCAHDADVRAAWWLFQDVQGCRHC